MPDTISWPVTHIILLEIKINFEKMEHNILILSLISGKIVFSHTWFEVNKTKSQPPITPFRIFSGNTSAGNKKY